MPKVEVGYWCHSRFARQEYITEAVRSITGFAFDYLDAWSVEIRYDSLNRLSVRVTERAGLRLKGELRNAKLDLDGGSRTRWFSR